MNKETRKPLWLGTFAGLSVSGGETTTVGAMEPAEQERERSQETDAEYLADVQLIRKVIFLNKLGDTIKGGIFLVLSWLIVDRVLDSFDNAVGQDTNIDVSLVATGSISLSIGANALYELNRRKQNSDLRRLRKRVEELTEAQKRIDTTGREIGKGNDL